MQDVPGDNNPGPGPDPTGAPAPPPPPPPAPAAPRSEPSKGLFDRAKDIITRPAQEFALIEREPGTIGSVFVPYALVLAAIGPVAGLIGSQVFGYGFGPISWRPPLGGAIAAAAIQYVFSLVGVFLLALIIDALAPSFGGQKSQVNAVKLAVYSYTAAWLAGIFGILPALAILGIVGLYSFYLLYVGMPILMKVPVDKAVGYVVVVVLAAIVIYFVIFYIIAALTMSFWGPALPTMHIG